jgi:hypothetical protein
VTGPTWIAATGGQPPLAQHVDQFLVSHPTTYLYTGAAQGGQTTLGSGSVATNGLYLAQSFTPGSSFSLGRVVVTLALTGLPVPATVSIQTSSGSAPSGTVLVSTSLPPAMVPGSAATVSIPAPCTLTSGTTYWIVVAAAGDASDFYAWSKSNQTSGASTSTNGTTWSAQAYGFYYALYDQSAVLPLVHAYDDAGARWSTLAWSAGQLTALQEYTAGQTAASPATSSVALSYSGTALTTVAAAGTTPAAPTWSAPHNGILGDASATAGAGQINQFLGAHALQMVYQGNAVLNPTGIGRVGFTYPLATADIDQPFTLSGTVTGRVEVPLLPVGQGADLLVSLCADNSGVPGTLITQARVSASRIYQSSAVAGISQSPSDAPSLEVTGNPLATARSTAFKAGTRTLDSYAYPAVGSGGGAASPAAAYYDTGAGTSYLYLVGGVNAGTALTNVFSITGSSDGTIATAVPQPSFPVATDGSGKSVVVVDAGGNATLVLAGGSSTFGGTPTANVFVSTIDTATGNLGAWSQQASLPVVVQNQGMAAYGAFVYVIGGIASPSTAPGYDTVYVGEVQNGQITGWSATTPFPTPISLSYVAVVSGYLMVAAGWTNSGFADTNAVWYAPINDDGSLGQWIAGPPLPRVEINADGTALQGNPFGTVVPTQGDGILGIGFDASGPGVAWGSNVAAFGTSNVWYADNGAGKVMLLYVNSVGQKGTMPLAVVPTISVPLPAAGLTSGSAYHILLQQQGGDLNNYLILWSELDSFPGNPTALTSPRAGYTWTALTPSGMSIPLSIYDGAPTASGEPVLHLWSDHGARITTIVSATTPDQRPLGVCEATRQAVALNTNQGFETGLSPWTWSGGTAVQSGTEVYEGAFSAQVTPSGTDATVYLQSENLPCMPGQSVTVTGWMRFTSAVTSNASMSVNWFDLTGAYLSTSSNNVSVPAATWTHLSNAFTAPTGAYGFTICPALSGTPSAANVFYVDVAHAHYTYTGPQASTVMAVEYAGTYPWPWPGLGARQLA